VRFRVTLRLAVYCQSVRLGAKTLEEHDQRFFFSLNLEVILLKQHPLWLDDSSVVYNCCWPSPAQSFFGTILAGPMIISCRLSFEIPQKLRTRSPYLYSPGTGWSSYTSRHWFPFRRLLRLAGLQCRYSNPHPHGPKILVTCLSVNIWLGLRSHLKENKTSVKDFNRLK
jgi:hypothetical protein